MSRSTSRIVLTACALLLAQFATGSAEAQQKSSAVPAAPRPVLPGPVSDGAALSGADAESFAGHQHGPVAKPPGHGAGSEAGGPSCGNNTCEAGEDACNCSEDCPGVCPCVLFDNEPDFVAFTEGQGRSRNAFETFEESILPPAEVVLMDDALRGGVPSLPDGFPFPNGLDVPSVCMQSNDLGGAPIHKSPRGVEGLAAASSGSSGAISDVVVANILEDSLDLLIIESGYRAVGFDTISFMGSGIAEIRVYARDNTTMFVAGISSADAIGSNFFGVSCSEQIGRINIFDTGNGAEGGDNIQMWGFFGPAECGNGVCEPAESCGAPEDPPPVCVEDCGTCSGTVNDDCQDAILIFDGPTDYDTTGMSTDGLQHDACQYCGQTHMDIWYQYEATCNGDLTVSTCDTADYDTDLVVYSGRHPDDWACPPGDGPLLGCNDDAPDCADFSSEVTVPVTAGDWYTIRVGGWEAGDQGPGTVTLTCDGGCGDDFCDAAVGEDECSCPEDCPGQCPCEIFSDAVEFEAFITALGNTRISMEGFEGSELPPASAGFLDDPLCGGVPNLPDGFPFPSGLGALSLCVQSNREHAPAGPNPRGVEGLAALSAGFQGLTSDVVVPGMSVDSLDLIFIDVHHIGVGFNPISLFGGARVDIQVFDKNNELMLVWESPADEAGGEFWGIACSEIVDRVNIYDPFDGGSEGHEGADNIQLWIHGDPCGACPTDVDGNGATAASDLAFLLGNWGPATPESQCLDADGDGIIGASDLAVLLGAWGACL